MAEISLTKENLKEIFLAFEHFFPEGVVYKVDRPFYSSEFNWKSRAKFVESINEFLKNSSLKLTVDSPPTEVRAAQSKLWELIETKKEAVEANTLDEQQRAQQKAELEKREKAAKEAAANAKRDVEAAIKRQKEIHESLKSKNIYRKVRVPSSHTLSPKEFATYDTLSKQALANPVELEKELSSEIQKRITQQSPDGQVDEIEVLSDQASLLVVRNLRGDSPAIEAASDYKILSERNLLETIDPNLALSVLEAANNVAGIEILKYQEARRVVAAAFGEDFADNFLGPKDLSSIDIEFSATKQEGYEPYNLSVISEKHLEFLNQRSEIFDHISINGTADFKSYFLRQTGFWVESQIPKNALLSKAFESAAVRSAFNIYVLGEPLVSTSLFGRIAIETGHGPILAWVGQTTGIDFGVTTAASITGGYISPAVSAAYYATTAESIALTSGVMTSEAFLGGAGTAIATTGGAAAGAGSGIVIGQLTIPIPVVGAAIGAVIGAVAPKLIGWAKDLFRKGKKFIITGIGVAFGAGLGAVIGIGAVTGGLIGGGLTLGATTFIGGGSSALLASMSNTITVGVAAVGFIYKTFIGSVGGPLLAFFIGFPVLVVLILVIINSGAYVVPIGDNLSVLNSTNPYMDVTKKANPSGQVPSPTTITYTITITAKKDALKILDVNTDCTAIKEGGSKIDCPDENLPTIPTSINPGSPFSFEFTMNFDSKFNDSLVTNSITIEASTPEVSSITETGSSSVCFGDCPLNCFDLSDPSWKQATNFQSTLTKAAGKLAGSYPDFATKVCAKPDPVKLCYTTDDPGPVGDKGLCNGVIYAIHKHNFPGGCDINFNRCGIENENDALYLLTHEVTHHLQKIDGQWEGYFEEAVKQANWPICTYSNTNGGDDDARAESMAEGAALYTGIKASFSDCVVNNFQAQYPQHFKYDKNCLFAAGSSGCKP